MLPSIQQRTQVDHGYEYPAARVTSSRQLQLYYIMQHYTHNTLNLTAYYR